MTGFIIIQLSLRIHQATFIIFSAVIQFSPDLLNLSTVFSIILNFSIKILRFILFEPQHHKSQHSEYNNCNLPFHNLDFLQHLFN